jgi:hypothetical protein
MSSPWRAPGLGPLNVKYQVPPTLQPLGAKREM